MPFTVTSACLLSGHHPPRSSHHHRQAFPGLRDNPTPWNSECSWRERWACVWGWSRGTARRSLTGQESQAPLTSHCQVDPAAPICGALSVSLAQACSLSDTPGLTMRPQVERWPPTDSGLWLLGQVPGSAGPGASPSSLQASAIPPSWPLGSTHTRDVLFQDFTRGGWEVEKEYGRRRAPHAPAERTAEAGAGPALEAPGLDISRYRSI